MLTLLKSKRNLILVFTAIFFFQNTTIQAQSKTFTVKSFDKVIVSPHLEVVFKTGEEEKVLVEMLTESLDEMNVEVKGKTLQLYLDDAKIVTEKDKEKSTKSRTVAAYKGTVAKVIVYYKKVKTFSLRGEERFYFEDAIISDKIIFNIYGASQVLMKDVTLKELKVSIYGESHLKIENGSIENQKIIGYGESVVDLLQVNNKSAKITAYGDGSYQCNVSNTLKIVSYGEPIITYKGSATLEKGLSIGEVEIVKIN
ncbi:DUF2807 domain-containing protein [Lacinutrix sp. C3R15]|uniref:GIN domain-containing protein n=1 Tax=Flavobacteriaceae TaxID=49546 RepID=UPI001C083348|nr:MULTISPECIES: DUF2807 domain-containing protein [Flavobacteriaceae]MBU2938755.1 DUF2807 domain-containing protein [Lacinutrix sp. C3R15]MDO6622068.1 DUF2807 domain-containing protein [Oceanihabitans sp. 1_MG-2023]